MDKVKIGSNRSFGIVFFIVFLIIGTYPIFFQGELRIWSLIVSIIFLLLGIINSRFLSPLNLLWFKFGMLLGRIVSPIVMGLVFFLVVTPTGLLMRLFGKDPLNTKFSKDDSYWIKREKNIGTIFYEDKQGNGRKEIEWKQNRAVFFSRTERETWHSYQGDGKCNRIALVYNLMTNNIKEVCKIEKKNYFISQFRYKINPYIYRFFKFTI